MSKGRSVSVFGPGALGGAMIDLIKKHSQFTLHSVWGRNAADSYYYSESEGKKRASDKSFPDQCGDLGKIIILAVPDDQLSAVAGRLSEIDVNWKEFCVIHLSGSHGADILAPISESGASVASIHPLQTFTRNDSASRFDGIWFTFQGDHSLFPLLKSLISPFGARSVPMSAEQKLTMHLAAVFASNYVVSLMEVVQQITEKNDIENGLELLRPIVHQTLENIFEKGATQSLSGPVARGDCSTIEKHLSQMEGNPEHAELYRSLGLIASGIAQKSGQLNTEKVLQVQNLLENDRG